MKRRVKIISIIVIIILIITACSGSGKNALLGRWQGYVKWDTDWDRGNDLMELEFLSNGVATSFNTRATNERNNHTWSVTDGNRLVINEWSWVQGRELEGVWTFSISDDTLTLERNNMKLTFKKIR